MKETNQDIILVPFFHRYNNHHSLLPSVSSSSCSWPWRIDSPRPLIRPNLAREIAQEQSRHVNLREEPRELGVVRCRQGCLGVWSVNVGERKSGNDIVIVISSIAFASLEIFPICVSANFQKKLQQTSTTNLNILSNF